MINVHTARINFENSQRSRANIMESTEYGIPHVLQRSGSSLNAECRRERVSLNRIRILPPLGHGDVWAGG